MTTTPQPIVVAAFSDRPQADQAIAELRNAGLGDQIRYWEADASSGGVVEAIKSVFTGKEGTSGNVYADLTGLGVPEADASFFQREADAGRAIVAVGAGNRQQEATTILARYGGYGATAGTSQSVDYTTTDSTSTAGTTVDTTAQTPARDVVTDVDTTTQAPARDVVTDTEGEQRLQLREEELRARKQPVEAGEVHLRKDVVTEEQTLNVPVSREEVYIERRPASGEVSDAPIDENETIEVPVREEQVQVEKQAVEREEIGLGKRQVQEDQQVKDTVRREKARIEREGDVTVRGDTDVVDTTRGERTRLEREGDTDANDVTS